MGNAAAFTNAHQQVRSIALSHVTEPAQSAARADAHRAPALPPPSRSTREGRRRSTPLRRGCSAARPLRDLSGNLTVGLWTILFMQYQDSFGFLKCLQTSLYASLTSLSL